MSSAFEPERIEWARVLAARQKSVELVFSTPQGEVLREWLEKDICRTSETTMTVPSDPLRTAFLEGRRSVWLEIQAEINKDSDELMRQARELERVMEDPDE